MYITHEWSWFRRPAGQLRFSSDSFSFSHSAFIFLILSCLASSSLIFFCCWSASEVCLMCFGKALWHGCCRFYVQWYHKEKYRIWSSVHSIDFLFLISCKEFLRSCTYVNLIRHWLQGVPLMPMPLFLRHCLNLVVVNSQHFLIH